MQWRAPQWATLLPGLLLAAGCAHGGDPGSDAGPVRPAVVEQSTPLRQPDSPYRTVVNGDTLYSIAWEVGRDYREVAAWNGIGPPYTIKPGQQLRVVPPPGGASSTAVSRTASPAGTTRGTAKRAVKPAKATQKPSATAARPTVAVVPKTGVSTASPSPKSGSKSGDGRSKAAPVVRSDGRGVGSWAWPADGQIVTRYAEADSKGVDIAGTRGAPVRAAANGRVVYQGSGLRGYGQLIIIKHSDEFLSAYAHNDRIHVKEGDAVKRGQKIADMGSSGTDRVKLHFEVRRRGVPTDPLQYLPKR